MKILTARWLARGETPLYQPSTFTVNVEGRDLCVEVREVAVAFEVEVPQG